MATATAVRIDMESDKETANTVRFTERVEDGERPRQFYVTKDDLASLGNPDKIKVTIEAA